MNRELAKLSAESNLNLEQIIQSSIPNSAGYDQPIILRGLRFLSSCPHRMTPTIGIAHICYIPKTRLLGIGSFATIVDGLASRPELQELLTMQIAEAIQFVADGKGTIVVLEATHYCSRISIDRQQSATMRTSAIKGTIEENTYREFLESISRTKQ